MKREARHGVSRPRVRRLAPLLVAAVALLAAGPAARAQKSEAEVLKPLKLAIKHSMADATDMLNEARTAYFVSLIKFEGLVKTGGFTEPMVHDLFEASIDLEQRLRYALFLSTPDLAGPTAELLLSFPDAVGRIDVARGTVESRIQKAVIAARKRVARLSRLIEEHAGYAVAVYFDVPLARPVGETWTKGDLSVTGVPLTLDVVVAGSSLAVVGDGVLYASGLAAASGEGTCSLSVQSIESQVDFQLAALEFDSPIPTPVERWSLQFGGGKQGLAEGLYSVVARLGPSTAVADIELR
jgi:hypothetical protein